MEKKIVILVQNSNKYPSNLSVPIIRRTYGKNKKIQLIFFQGNSDVDELIKSDTLKLNVSGDYDFLSEKLLKCFEWVDTNIEYDYILRTTTTTYIDIDNLINFLEDKNTNRYYSSTKVPYPPVAEPGEARFIFGSGAGLILSRDVVRFVLSNKKYWDFEMLDDVALGKLLLSENNFELSEGYRQDFYNGYPLTKNIKTKNYIYRFKSSINYYPRFLEVFTLLSLHMRIKGIKKNSRFKILLFQMFDFLFVIIYKVIRLFNLNLLYARVNILIRKANKFIVLVIKSNKFIKNIFTIIKKKTNFKGFI